MCFDRVSLALLEDLTTVLSPLMIIPRRPKIQGYTLEPGLFQFVHLIFCYLCPRLPCPLPGTLEKPCFSAFPQIFGCLEPMVSV